MQATESALFRLNPIAMLFTNSAGRVVFANRNFLRLTRQAASRMVAGESLDAFLPVDPQSAAKVIYAIGQSGYVDNLPMSVSTITGSIIPAMCSGAAARDEKGVFIGADIILNSHPMIPSPVQGILAPKHTDVLHAYVSEVFAGASRAPANTFIQSYVMAQVDMLQVLLARMGGPEMRNTLERILNETAVRNDIPANMEDGYLAFTHKPMHFSVYNALLRAVMGYAVIAIGQRMVKREMQAVDRYVDPGLLELLTQMDLRTSFTDD
jgi:hypothetical protein